MTSLAILVLVAVALSRHRWRRRRDHVPRLLAIGDRRHGTACGCEACLENRMHERARLAFQAEAARVAELRARVQTEADHVTSLGTHLAMLRRRHEVTLRRVQRSRIAIAAKRGVS